MDLPGPIRYVPAIDGVRAIAVLAVVAFHIDTPGFAGGYAGVDVFFVISGYLISRLLRDELSATGSIAMRDFYARRVRRLLPAFALVLAATLIAGAFIVFPDELPRLRDSANASALAVSNLHFMRFSGGYFDPTSETMPLLHTWSLAVEEQYYLVWPIFLLMVAKWGRTTQFDRHFLIALLGVAAISYPACLWYSFDAPGKAFYLMPLRAWELASGGLMLTAQERLRPGPLGARAAVIVGLLAMATYFGFPQIAQPFPGLGAALPVLGCCLVLFGVSFADSDTPEVRFLQCGPMRVIGLASYSFYLWHWPILALSRAYFLDMGDLRRNGTLMVVAFLLALATYRWVETPVRQRRVGPFASRRGTFVMGGTLLFSALLIGNLAIHFQRAAGETELKEWGGTLGESPFGVSKCGESLPQATSANAADCTYGAPSSAPDFVIWGDSHAGALADLAERFATEQRGSVLLRAFTGCPSLVGAMPVDKDTPVPECARYNRNVEAEIRTLSKRGTRGVLLVLLCQVA